MRLSSRSTVLTVVLLTLLATLSCEDTGVNAPSTGSITVTANPGTIVLDPALGITSGQTVIAARVFDANGNPISGVNVNFTTSAGALASAANNCISGSCSRTGDSCTVNADCPLVNGLTVLTDGNGVAVDTLTLTVNDPTEAEVTAFSATLSSMVTVMRTSVGVNQLPTAVAFPNPPGFSGACESSSSLCKQDVLQQVLFDGSDSTDTDGTITCYQWEIDSSDNFSDETVQGSGLQSFFRTYMTEQSLAIILRVSDDPTASAACNSNTPADQSLFGDSASFIYQICDNDPPTANAGADTSAQLGGNMSVTVRLSGALSTDVAPGSIDVYDWNCGGGTATAVPNQPAEVDCEYDSLGSYTAELTVSDNGNGVCQESDTDTVLVTVN